MFAIGNAITPVSTINDEKRADDFMVFGKRQKFCIYHTSNLDSVGYQDVGSQKRISLRPVSYTWPVLTDEI
jgi:hypothetical protein